MLLLYMAWLPNEDAIAKKSEELVLTYSPDWSGAGETRHPIQIPEMACTYFELEEHEEYDVEIPFTRESWHGRMRACRGAGASFTFVALLRILCLPLCLLFGRQVGIVPEPTLCHDSHIVPRMTELFAILKVESNTLRVVIHK